ncbi:MAG: hypothetical protein R6V74_10860, partial [Lutibacter sp.]
MAIWWRFILVSFEVGHDDVFDDPLLVQGFDLVVEQVEHADAGGTGVLDLVGHLIGLVHHVDRGGAHPAQR